MQPEAPEEDTRPQTLQTSRRSLPGSLSAAQRLWLTAVMVGGAALLLKTLLFPSTEAASNEVPLTNAAIGPYLTTQSTRSAPNVVGTAHLTVPDSFSRHEAILLPQANPQRNGREHAPRIAPVEVPPRPRRYTSPFFLVPRTFVIVLPARRW